MLGLKLNHVSKRGHWSYSDCRCFCNDAALLSNYHLHSLLPHIVLLRVMCRQICINWVTREPGTPITNGLWAHNANLVNIELVLTWIIITQSGHNFVHATTAELSWHVQNCDLIWGMESTFGQMWLSQDFSYELIDSLWKRLQVYRMCSSAQLYTWMNYAIADLAKPFYTQGFGNPIASVIIG